MRAGGCAPGLPLFRSPGRQEIAGRQLPYLQELVKRQLFPPHSYLRKQMFTLQPSPQFGAYLLNKADLQMPPCPWQSRKAQRAAGARSVLPAAGGVRVGGGGPRPMSCLLHQGAGGRGGLGRKIPAQSCLCLSRSLPPGIGLHADSCREVPAWHPGWPQA